MKSQPHTFRQYLYWLAFCYRPTSVRNGTLLTYTTKCTDWLRYAYSRRMVLCLGHMLWHAPLIVPYAFLALSKRRFSLDSHTVWESVFDGLLKSIASWVRSPFTLQHVFTCWASTLTHKASVVKLWLCVIWTLCRVFYSIKQESSVGTE
jgi:hypothetical protein